MRMINYAQEPITIGDARPFYPGPSEDRGDSGLAIITGPGVSDVLGERIGTVWVITSYGAREVSTTSMGVMIFDED